MSMSGRGRGRGRGSKRRCGKVERGGGAIRVYYSVVGQRKEANIERGERGSR